MECAPKVVMQRNATKFYVIHNFVGLAYQGKKDIVFRFIVEYTSSRDFGP